MERKQLEIAQLNLTNECQCNCKHCGVAFLRKQIKDTLSLEEIDEIFRDLKVSGCKLVDLFGGEPTLRKDIFEIIKLGKSYGFGMLIETNGFLLNDEYVNKLKDAGLDRIFISLDDFRPEIHDSKRVKTGLFDRVVRAIKIASQKGIGVHVSIVPPNKEYFINGDINKFLKLCFDLGAEKVRILFPSEVGNWSIKNNQKTKIKKNEEKQVFDYIDKEYIDKIYTEAEHNKIGDDTKCSAKIFFVHIMSNGYVLPCPYLPLVFGDIKKESMTTIFSRIQEHPIMKKNGFYCPSRDKEFMNKYLSEINEQNPFKFVKSENLINVAGPCNNNCKDCSLKYRAKEEIISQIKSIDDDYSTLHIYGGEPFLRKDIYEIIDEIPKKFALNIYTNSRIFIYPEMIKKIQKYNINSFKVPLFSNNNSEHDTHTNKRKSFDQTILGIKNLVKANYPVCIYMPEDKINNEIIEKLKSLGVVSISSFTQARNDETPNEQLTMCFGKHISKEKLIWLIQ